MAMHPSNKKGQTLIEVTVALGILAVVFAGTVTLVVNVLKLNLAAREKTQAVAFAQEGISFAIQNIGSNCTATTLADKTDVSSLGGINYTRLITTKPANVSGGTVSTAGPAPFSYLLVTSHVSWPGRYGTTEYEIIELVRSNQ